MPTIRNIDAATLADWQRKGIIAATSGERTTATPGTWTLTILNWRPYSLNDLINVHYMTAYRRKKADKKRIAAEKMIQGIPDASHKRRVKLRIVLQGKDKILDRENAYKSLLDAMVSARLLVDDSPRWVETTEPEYEKGKRATVITLDDLIDA